MRLNKNIKIFLNYFLGPLLFIWLSVSIYNEIRHQPDLRTSWTKIKESVQSAAIWNFVIVVFLMILNWSIEALKWQISIQHLQRIGFLKSFRAVLSGVSFSVNTPNRIGEYLGRVLYIDEGNRLKAVSLTIVCSMSQLIITLLAGLTSLFFLKTRIDNSDMAQGHDSSLWIHIVLYGLIVVLLILTLFYFRLSMLTALVERLPVAGRYAWVVNSLRTLRATLLLKLLSLSAIRYIVFAVQYYLLFRLFGVHMEWWQSFWAVSVVFLVLAIIPTFAIAELGLRGKVSLKFFGLFSANSLGISITAATIWLVNLILPAVAGSLFIVSIKLFKNKNERN